MYGIPNTNPDPQHHIQLQFFFLKKRCDTFSVDEPLRLPDKDLVALVIFGGDQDDGPLGPQQAQQDLGRRLHLLLQGSIRHQAHLQTVKIKHPSQGSITHP